MKNFLQSKTIYGLLLMAIPWLAKNVLGIEVGEAQAQSALETLIQIVGFGLAVYGRFVASKGLTLK